jgi:hypothetical protein
MEEITPPFTHERVWAWCAQAGELAVEERLGEATTRDTARPWNNADLRKHARAWVRKQKWDRQRAADALAKSAVRAAWSAALAAAVSAITALLAIYLSIMPAN